MGTSSTYNKDLLRQKSQIFYNDLSKLNTVQTMNNDNTENLSENIKINISLKEINKNSSYKMKISKLDNNVIHPIDDFTDLTFEDDKIANLDAPLIVNYRFEREQPLNIDIVKESLNESKSCEIKTSLGNIMGSRNNTLQKNMSNMGNEQLIIKAEKLKQNEDIINIKFDIKSNEKVSFKEIKNKIYYEIYSKSLLYRSEFLNDKGVFDTIKLPKYLFKNNNLKIKFYDCNKKEVGDFDLNIQEFTNEKSFNIKVKGTKYEIISKSKLTKDFTFVDYLKAGVQIGLSVTIDFTMSNLFPNDEKSLHYISGLEPNQYERAILACGNIVAYYDYDQFFPCFGFGAKINNQKYELFNLNFQVDPNVKYIQGIIDAYHNAIKIVELYGPTNFGPILRKINNMIKNDYNIFFKYHILMILTDGKIDDMDDTIEELVEGSFLPLSVIIIGVGNADFSSMIELDADEKPLINSKGVVAARDLVQFVPFLKYESYPEQLANEVLEEIPRQFMEYYELKNLDPTKLVPKALSYKYT